MDTMYQRGKIQEESMYYEHKKHDGSLPLIGVNTFLPKEHAGDIVTTIELKPGSEETGVRVHFPEQGRATGVVCRSMRDSIRPIGSA